MASVAGGDKTYIKVGKDLNIDADIWHALACEPVMFVCVCVCVCVRVWILMPIFGTLLLASR